MAGAELARNLNRNQFLCDTDQQRESEQRAMNQRRWNCEISVVAWLHAATRRGFEIANTRFSFVPSTRDDSIERGGSQPSRSHQAAPRQLVWRLEPYPMLRS